MVDKQPARVPNLGSWKPSFKADDSQLQLVNHKVVNKLHEQLHTEVRNQPETTLNQEFQPQNPNFQEGERTLWDEIKTALDAGRSVDWCSKNLTGLPGNYYSARKIVEDLINQHNQSDN
jgi:hypothetical protein